MTNAQPRQQYEGAILQQLIKNSERLVIVENTISTLVTQGNNLEQRFDGLEEKVDYIYKSLKWIIGLLGTVLIAVLANLLSQPILSLIN